MYKAQWTRDSQYFVFTTQCSGGHQPYWYATRFWSRTQNRFFCFDDLVDRTGTAKFRLTGRNTVHATYLDQLKDEWNVQFAVPLDRLLAKRSQPHRTR